VFAGVLLAASTAAVQAAEDRKCIREMMELLLDMKAAKRQCDPKNFVSDPNEYGWVRSGGCGAVRVKGSGAKKPEDAMCH
jgi:hypothetical protein